MHFSGLSVISALALLTALSLSVPFFTDDKSPLILAPRSQYCYNAPSVVAGTLYDRRTLTPNSPLLRRAPPGPATVWCAMGGRAFLVVTYQYSIPGPLPQTVIAGAQAEVEETLYYGEDKPIPHGSYQLEEQGVEVTFQNANNHQCTWGVVGAALSALQDYMQNLLAVNQGNYGAVSFTLNDGFHEVGTGALQYA